MPCIRAGGQQIVPLTIILHGTGANIGFPELAHMLLHRSHVRVLYQPAAWADTIAMLDWLENIFVPSVRGASITGPVMLGMDKHGPQITSLFRDACAQHDVYPVYTPEGTTDVTAPVDHHVGCFIKGLMQKLWTTELTTNYALWTEGEDAMHGLNATYRRMLLVQWSAEAWRVTCSRHTLLLNSFIRTGFLSRMDGSDKHLLQVKGCDSYDPDDPQWDETNSDISDAGSDESSDS